MGKNSQLTQGSLGPAGDADWENWVGQTFRTGVGGKGITRRWQRTQSGSTPLRKAHFQSTQTKPAIKKHSWNEYAKMEYKEAKRRGSGIGSESWLGL